MKLFLLLLTALAGVATWTPAQPAGSPAPPLTCVVCAKPVTGRYFTHVVGGVTNAICAACEALPNRCALCKLPVKDGFTKTADGRFFCKKDAGEVVLSEDEARKLFAQARGDLREVSGGALDLRSQQVNVQVLFNLDFADNRNGTNGAMHRTGFSMSRPQGDGFAHNVVLLNGQPRTATLSTSAHEFGHLWLTENLKPSRKLDPDTREALCELFAFKLAARRNDTNEIARIKANPYTKGVILSAIEFEAREGVSGVVKWVRESSEEKLPAATGAALAIAKSSPPAPEPPPELRPPPPPPTKLELRSLLRTSKRTVAVINGERFEMDHELSMLVDGKRHLVRLVEAQNNAVVVTVDGTSQTLRLGEK
ncbi:MAG: hypothetical protein ACKODH_10020 [Limisphaerales bacterium]